jgi:hypothetical protein
MAIKCVSFLPGTIIGNIVVLDKYAKIGILIKHKKSRSRLE